MKSKKIVVSKLNKLNDILLKTVSRHSVHNNYIIIYDCNTMSSNIAVIGLV